MANKPYPFSVCSECAGGGSGDIDLSYYIQSYNKNTHYKVGDFVIGDFYHTRAKQDITIIAECIKEHTSPDIDITPDMDNEYWKFHQIKSFNAMRDIKGNDIVNTYATKEELGDIETALDNIIEIQNSLIGGESV